LVTLIALLAGLTLRAFHSRRSLVNHIICVIAQALERRRVLLGIVARSLDLCGKIRSGLRLLLRRLVQEFPSKKRRQEQQPDAQQREHYH
jgi:hypothetical protein